MHGFRTPRLKIAIVGSGIAGLSTAWLLASRHDVVVYESASRLGGHTNTVEAQTADGPVAVDTGFIVYNELNYPNLTALFQHLGVATQGSDMSFAVSLDGGGLEYSGNSMAGLFAQKRNVFRPRFWSMLNDLNRFYREAPRHIAALEDLRTTLGDYLLSHDYGRAFRDDHLLPLAAAIWSAQPQALLNYPAGAFLRFQQNHGLMRIRNRPVWRTVKGGSKRYIERLIGDQNLTIRLNAGVRAIRRGDDGAVTIVDASGASDTFDHVVVGAHADQALAMLDDPSADERALLGAFRYTRNQALLHTDATLMPKRRAVWSSWNYIGRPSDDDQVCVTYWMNQLQNLHQHKPLFVTLNAARPPRDETVLHTETYEHPLLDGDAMQAQRRLWSLQGVRNTWFCGSYFGAGFHEDGLQSGLAVAEALGGVRRPWTVENESARISLPAAPPAVLASPPEALLS